MQPGALPASQHHFENNMTALALATVLEGCIGETLSALELAAEVDDTAAVGVDDKLTELLMKNTETIALDEGRHSSLAWRTIHWVCRVDSDACNTVQRQIFGVSTLTEAVSKRLPAGNVEIQEAWTRIHETLVPFVTALDRAKIAKATRVYCSSPNTTFDKSNNGANGVLEQLTDNIIRGVVCGVESRTFTETN